MPVRQMTYDQRFTIGPETPASTIERQEVRLDVMYSMSLQWIDTTGELRISLWSSSSGIKTRFASTILPAADATTFVQTLVARQPS